MLAPPNLTALLHPLLPRPAAPCSRLYEVGKRQAAGYGLFVMFGHIACYASKVAALVVGCSMVMNGTLTAEALTNFIFYGEREGGNCQALR